MTAAKKQRLARAPLQTQEYMDRLRTVWRMALELNDEDTLTMVKRGLTGTFKVILKDNELEFDHIPSFKDNTLAIKPSAERKLNGLEKRLKRMKREVLQTRQAPRTDPDAQNVAAK